jgi:pilus assembly protein Flp/PilA
MFKNRRNKHEKGQGLVEYALILVLVAVVVIVVLAMLGPGIQKIMFQVSLALGHQTTITEFCEMAGIPQATSFTIADNSLARNGLPDGVYSCP